ncbi:MAG TPA: prephenate dehydrogenase/arogenate dehydrogenase family protein [Mariprofundaceae bacterium]|nr:prephenate dehydrogenase/arogenate dehydrogenase family protein [Mariprofundaceae bacterium]
MLQQIEHLAVIGVGLIGGSVARSLKRAGYAKRITGIGRNAAHLEQAKALGVVDDVSTDIARGVEEADVVLVSVPMSAYGAVLSQLTGHLKPGAVLTDAGSTKQHAVDAAHHSLTDDELARFVPAHPIAGTEHSGVEASFASLFDGRLCVLTPMTQTDTAALETARTMWQATGSRLMQMDAKEHDDFLAAVSHLPHLIAFGLVNAVRKLGDDNHDPFCFAAGGFRDFTRIASSSPEMWRDIALCNREALVEKLDALEVELNALRKALEAGDGEALVNDFRAAKEARDAWLATHGEGL